MNRSTWLLIATLAIMVVSISSFAPAQDSPLQGNIIKPPSSAGTVPGVRARTDLLIVRPDGEFAPNSPPPNSENPGTLACIYGVTPPTNGCPFSGSPLATGGSKAIAVVEYGHNSTLQADFNTFNSYWGLPAQTLKFICDCASCPSADGTGWDVETALDTQYAHAMAPHAQIIVSQFCNDPYTDPAPAAEVLGAQAVAGFGGGEVSNSFCENFNNNPNCTEDPSELGYDQYMTEATVVFFASAGDGGWGALYPSSSPNVVSAGGTHIVRSSGQYTGAQTCWGGSGGGVSLYEPLPNYQLIIGNKTGPKRGTPDYAADADPNTGVALYSTTGCGGWCKVGGTSVSSPVLAGIVNAAGKFVNHTASELHTSYNYYLNPGLYHQYFYDVTSGSNGSGHNATLGWDECTGLGAPANLAGF